jgi:FixJ family two-component response regulator
MLTGHASVEFGLKGMQLGAFDYVMKPAPLNELLDTIGQAYNKNGACSTKSRTTFSRLTLPSSGRHRMTNPGTKRSAGHQERGGRE